VVVRGLSFTGGQGQDGSAGGQLLVRTYNICYLWNAFAGFNLNSKQQRLYLGLEECPDGLVFGCHGTWIEVVILYNDETSSYQL